jgi:predicted TIM-barrel fold metal-dependent hydrolase
MGGVSWRARGGVILLRSVWTGMEWAMKAWMVAGLLVLGMGMVGCKQQAAPAAGGAAVASGPFTSEELQAFAALAPIDSHAHVFANDAAFDAMLKRLNVHMVDILVIDDQNPEYKASAAKVAEAWKFVEGSEGHAVYCTSFDPYKWKEPGFAAAANRGLDKEFGRGAVAVKLWKNVGMEIKDAKGNYILPDNAVFAPIYKNIAAQNKTLIAHVADPSSSWAPIDPSSPDYSYYRDNPVWYMYGQKNPASKEQILTARDHVVEQNPNLRVVGAHLGSMEADFKQLGEHLDKYPNFAVDMAARMPYIMLQPRADMIAFITRYQDKLLYATDLEYSAKDNADAKLKEWEAAYARDWRFLATNDTVEYNGRTFQGLALPADVLKRIYHDNAVKWIPGVVGR